MTNVNRRSFLGAAATVAIVAPTGLPTASEVDPVFAAIERHKPLHAAHRAAADLSDEMATRYGFESPEEAGAYASQCTACDAEVEALREVVETVPTTMAGLAAYVEHIGGDLGFHRIGAHGEDFVALIATLRTFANRRLA